jgi:signal transduction histidine kinase
MLSLFGLYLFATSITAQDAINLARANTIKSATGEPIGAYLAQLDVERPLAMVYLSAPTSGNLTALRMQGQKTDRVGQMMRAALTSAKTMDNASPAEKRAIATLLKDESSMSGLRAQVGSRVIGKPLTLESYDNVVTDAYTVLNLAIHEETDAPLVTAGLAFVRMGRAEDLLLREDAVLEGAFAARSFPPADRQTFTQLAGARRNLYNITLNDLDPTYRVYYDRNIDAGATAALTAMEDRIIGNPRPGLPPVNPVNWQHAVQAVSAGLSQAGNQAANALTNQASSVASSTNLRLALAGGFGLLAVVISIVVAILTSRSLVRELSTLRRSALELANDRLPDVVARLADGQAIEPPEEKALEIPAKSDEIGQVRDAFAKVQRTAVEAAVGQARLREGISDVFRNLARRSQSLLHRQLTLLDGMERRAADPEQLADLFRIDHLTTRMRRHAESLIILSGQAPARGWRHPVPLVDVLRAAVAEVEDYTRVKVIATTKASLAGPAVADVIHMLAELAENATVFSPPNTPVLITGDLVGRGFAVEIEDRGLGLGEEKVAEINERLANPPPFDPSGTDQLGLFVASQLAKRHDIKIRLRESPYGGTTAIVLIPHSLVIPDGTKEQLPAAAAGLVPTGRHASREEAKPNGNGHEPAGWMAGRALGGSGYAAETTAAPEQPAPARAWDSHSWDSAPAWDPSAGAVGSETASTAAPGNLTAGAADAGPVPVTDLPRRDSSPDAAGSESAGLPRRVRQASLAPQLRTSTARVSPPASAELLAGNAPLGTPMHDEHHEARTPDETRATLSAIQRGWQRGRSAGGDYEPGAASGSGPAGPPPLSGNGDPAASGFSAGGVFSGGAAFADPGDYPRAGTFPATGGFQQPDDPAGPEHPGTPAASGYASGLAGANGNTDANGYSGATEDTGPAAEPGPGQAEDVAEAARPGGSNGHADASDQPPSSGLDYADDPDNTSQFAVQDDLTGGAGEAGNGAQADPPAAVAPEASPAAADDEQARDNETGSDGGGLSGWS